MPVSTTVSHGLTSGAQTSLTISHTSDANPLYVLLSWYVGSGAIEDASLVTGVTFNGVALTRGGHQAVAGQTMEWWRLAAPALTTANVVLTLSSARRVTAAVLNLSGWPSSVARHRFSASGGLVSHAQPSNVVPSDDAAEAIDWLSFNYNPGQVSTPGLGQSELWSQDGLGGGSGAGGDQKSAGSLKAGADSVVTTWTLTVSAEYWGLAAISFIPDAVTLAPIAYEDACTITQPRLHLKIETPTETLRAAVGPLRDSAVLGGFKEPRILEVGPIGRYSSQPNDGSLSASTATAKLADTDRRYRAASDALGTMRGLPIEFYLSSKDQSLADLFPRMLFAGEIYRDAARENMAFEIVANDIIGRQYTLSGDERKVPQRFVNASDFPNASATSLGQGVPIAYGLVEDRGNPPTGGVHPCIDVGVITISGTDYRAVLVAGHAITKFEMNAAGVPADPEIWFDGTPVPYADYGTKIWAPQIPGDLTWAAQFGADPFTDITPVPGLGQTRRYTLILMPAVGQYATALDGGAQVHVDLSGIEDVGDGSGALITDYFQQYYHALVNWILQNYQSGLWLTAPQFVFVDGVTMLDRIKQASFATASSTFTSVRGVAPIGGFILNTRTSIRDVIKNLNFSIGCLLGQDDYGRFYVRVLDTNRTRFLTNEYTGLEHRVLRDKVDILPGMYAEPQSEWFTDCIIHHWAPNYAQGRLDRGFGPVAGSNEVDELNTKKEITLPYIRDDATANAVAAYYLMLFSADPKLIHYSRRGLCGLEDDVLTGVPITHYNGYGPNGYQERAGLVLSKVFNPKTNHCDFVALDAEPYLNADVPAEAVGLFLDPDALEALYADDGSGVQLTLDGA